MGPVGSFFHAGIDRADAIAGAAMAHSTLARLALRIRGMLGAASHRASIRDRPPSRVNVLTLPAAIVLSSWLGACACAVAAEVLIFPDLPSPPFAHILEGLLSAALSLLPLGAACALCAGLLLLATRWHARAPRLVSGCAAALPCAALTLPLAGIPLLAGTLALATAGILLAGGVALSIAAGSWLATHAQRRHGIGLAVAALCAPMWLSLVAGLAPSAGRPGEPLARAQGQRVVLLGADGATWTIINPMLARGELPHIADLMQRGTHAPLRSLEPMLSNRVWTSAATGVVPERHGITDFFFDRRSIRVPTMWDLVHQDNGRLGIFEYLVTSPPLAVNGFALPGWMSLHPGATHPPRLIRRMWILAVIRHPWMAARYFWERGRADPLLNVKEFVETTFKTTLYIDFCRRCEPDLSALVWYGTDRMGHTLWRYHDPGAFPGSPHPASGRLRAVLSNYYRAVDREVGRVVSALDDGRTLFILMSDHGMGPAEEVRVTAFLKGAPILSALGLERDLYVESPHSELILNCRVEGRQKRWTVARADHARVAAEAVERFREVLRADTHEPLFEASLMDLERGDLKVRARDVATLTPATPVQIGARRVPAGDLISLTEISGTHRLHGILVLAGRPVQHGAALDDPCLLDIAPTILRVLGFPVAQDLDGHVLEEALEPAWRADHPLQTVASYGTVDHPIAVPQKPSEELLEKLRGLGYID